MSADPPETVDPEYLKPQPEGHHRNIQAGSARAAVFGVMDGLVSNLSLILGVAGADDAQDIVRLAGVAGLVAGAVSMAAGEYNSMQAQRELLERELEIERREHVRNPNVEIVELAQIYQSRGMEPDHAIAMARQLMDDPEKALEVHAREELGIDPNELGDPFKASVASFFAFGVGALVPLLPWFYTGGTTAVVLSIVLGAIAALTVGAILGWFTGRSKIRLALRQLLIVAAASSLTYLIGTLIGVSTG